MHHNKYNVYFNVIYFNLYCCLQLSFIWKIIKKHTMIHIVFCPCVQTKRTDFCLILTNEHNSEMLCGTEWFKKLLTTGCFGLVF